MRLIDRYIVREVLLPFAIALLVFTFVLIIPFLIDYAEQFIAKGVPFSIVLRIMGTLLPQALALAIPAALLVGLLMAFGRLSADREFVAMQACGIGLGRLLRPVGVVSLLGWAATSYVMLEALPNGNQTYREITFSLLASRAEGEVKPRTFFLGFPDLALYVREIPPSGGWNDVFMSDSRPGQPPAVYFARHGRVVINREQRTVAMVMTDAVRHSVDANGEYQILRFDEQILTVNPETVFPRSGPQKGDAEMTIAELRAHAAAIEARGESSHNQLMAIHKKFSIPIACLVFGLIGLALGATNRRDGRMGSFVFGLAVIFAYYVPLQAGPALAKGQHIPAWLAVWFPNFLLGAIGITMLMRRARAADQPLFLGIPQRVSQFWERRRRANAGSEATSGRMRGMATILDRYVGATYLRVFAIATLGLAGLFYISTFLDLSDKLFKGETTLAMIGQFFWYITPQYTYYVLPMAVLIATLVTIGLLTKNSELVVMKACGISLYRVALPVVAGALLAGGTLFALDQSILGPSNRQAKAIRHVIRGGSLETFDVLNRQWLAGSRGEIYHYNYFNPARRQLVGLEVFEFGSGRQVFASRTYADRATYVDGRGWMADTGWRRDFDEQGNVQRLDDLKERWLPLEPVTTFATQKPEPEFMSYLQLRRYIGELRNSGFDVSEQQVALERKLSFPFVTIIMTLIAVPFAVTTGRRGALYGIGVGIVLAISYWTTISVFAALGTGGALAPLVAAWAPNVLFGTGAAYLLLTVRT